MKSREKTWPVKSSSIDAKKKKRFVFYRSKFQSKKFGGPKKKWINYAGYRTLNVSFVHFKITQNALSVLPITTMMLEIGEYYFCLS
jgi:hypothetical protein